MKLLYIYTEKHPPFNRVEFNFDSNIRFNFSCPQGQPTIAISEKDIVPFRFFRSGLCREDFIASVSAIVGVNGSGKTTLADLIRRLIENNSVRGNYIIAYEVSGKIFIKYRFAEKRGIRNCELILCGTSKISKQINIIGSGRADNVSVNRYLSKATLTYLYMSPYFTTERKVSCNNINTFDMSTTSLLHEAVSKYKDDGLDHFNSDEKIRVLRMIREFTRLKSRNTAKQTLILKASGVYLNFEYADCWNKLNELAGKDFGEYNQWIKILLRLLDRIPLHKGRKRRLEDFPLRYIVLITVKVLFEKFQDMLITGKMLTHRYTYDLNNVFEFLGSNIEMLEKCEGYSNKVIKANELIHELPNNDTISVQYKKLYSLLQMSSSSGVVLNNNGVYFSFTDMESATETFLNAVGVNAIIPEPLRVFKCDICPKLSSGEMAFLGYWGRILGFLDSQGWRDGKKHQLIVFLDEMETSLHPEWQRRLVWDTIRFFETFAPLVRVHIIFASHSPILLSDIPKGNICFLPLRRNTYFNKRMDKIWRTQLDEMDNTFALDIFDLYRIPFFLHNGTIGEFARNKLNIACEKNVVRQKDGTDQGEEIIRLIGDDFLRGCIFRRHRCHKDNETY